MPDPVTVDPIVDHYSVTANGAVQAHIIIGQGQPGGSSAVLDGIELGHGNENLTVDVGKGSDLGGKTLTVVAVTQDQVPETDRTSFRLILTGGTPSPKQWDADFTATKGQQVTYIASITFI